MEVEKSKVFEFAEDDFLWRYIDINKLFSFLENENKLFFTRLDKFEDPLEGLTTKLLVEVQNLDLLPTRKSDFTSGFSDEDRESLLREWQIQREVINLELEKNQKSQFANCWFVGKKESFAMWNLYSNKNNVAICYNPWELINIVIPSAESYNNSDFVKFIYGFVEYESIWPFDYYKKDRIKIKHHAFRKDSSYYHEREFRFVVQTPLNNTKHENFELPLGNISLDNFKIYANPHMENWKFETWKKVLKKYSIHDKFVKSVLKIKG